MNESIWKGKQDPRKAYTNSTTQRLWTVESDWIGND